jgi:preprotein translocase subunit SecB
VRVTELEPQLLSGISFDWVIVRELRFADNLAQDTFAVPLSDMVADVQVESRVDEEKRSCRTLVRVTLTPSAKQQSQLQIVAAALEGQFSATSASPTVEMAAFAKRQAPAIIMPFVREAIASATAKSRFGQVLLPPINVIALMEAREREQLSGQATLLTKVESADRPA